MHECRRLTLREREILGLLLAAKTPGVAELRQQSEVVLARPWTCGCASIDLVVDRTRARPSSIRRRPAIETQSKEREDQTVFFELLLWVDANVFPPPTDFHPPGTASAA